MKTINDFGNLNKNFFEYFNKKINNYSTQLTLYQHMFKTKYIYLLLLSRNTYDFTIIPFNFNKYITNVKENCNKWIHSYIQTKL